MISGKLIGGIGNQMSVIAAVYALARRNKVECGFHLPSCYTPLQGNPASKYADNIFKNLPKIDFDPEFNLTYRYNEPRHKFDELPFKDGTLYSGYFQSKKYWQDCEEDIKNLFDVPPIMKYNYNITGVHVRRGDYKNNPDIHPICSVEYYRAAMDLIGGEFIFFSDDMNWVKENFYGKGIIYSNFADEINDFRMLTHCNNIIGSNSTFSLWSSFLNPHKDAKMIFPKVEDWFGKNGPDATDIVPENYIRI